jgi:diguanylate cyclase (GGDEF)-like protein
MESLLNFQFPPSSVVAAMFDVLGEGGNAVAKGRGPLARLLREQTISSVFQPIATLRDGAIHAHEALMRGPVGEPLQSADAMLRSARCEGLLHELEVFSAVSAMARWGVLQPPGRLFVNMSADVLIRLVRRGGSHFLADMLDELGVDPAVLVLEITEHERVSDMNELADVADTVHALGTSLALDDFGDGHSSLRLWAQIKPDIVKIDKYFTKDISSHADNLKTLQALLQIAEVFGTSLVAEGIENESDLRVLRDLGITYGQGYFLGRPSATVSPSIQSDALAVLKDPRVAVPPQRRHVSSVGPLRGLALVEAPSLGLEASNDDVARLFQSRADLHAVALTVEGRPVAIINRREFMDRYATLYFREVLGRKNCAAHANFAPRLIERNHDVGALAAILTSQDQRYLADGFVVVDQGRYVGLGTGDQLVRSVTEARLEAARHANSLTLLPGNIPTSQHIQRLLDSGAAFTVCHADINDFKPFNDQYGYWRGDEVIRRLAQLAVAHADPQRDFVGHVGGDDFLLLFQSDDWKRRCHLIVREFAALTQSLYPDSDRRAGGMHAQDRHGVTRFFPCVSLSIGALCIEGGEFRDADEVAAQAALAKHHAKTQGVGLYELAPMSRLAA